MPAAFLVLLTVGCDAPTGLAFPTDAVQYEPLPVYAEWWRLVESCSGVQGDLSAVRWYHAPRASIVATFSRQAGALWTGDGNRVLMSSDRLGEGRLVRHEMLHALRRVGGHARTDFMQRCAGLVSCDGDCLRDAGPAPVPAATTRRVPSDSLVVWNEVTPRTPGSRTWGGFFMLTVHVRNPYDESVVVVLPPSGDGGAPVSFRYRGDTPGGYWTFNFRADDGAVYLFSPGEEKRMVFDLSVSSRFEQFPIAPGTWSMRGWFGEHEGTPVTVVVAR